jgi:hypothetical protein
LEGKYDLSSTHVVQQILDHRKVSSDLHKIIKITGL